MKKEFIVYVKMVKSKKLITGVSNNMKAVVNGKAVISNNGAAGNIKVVYYEIKKSKRQAIAREKELKTLNRKKLTSFVGYHNPDMLDLSKTWIEENTYFTQNVLFLT